MNAVKEYKTDVIKTSAGDLAMTFLGHGSLLLIFNGKYLYVDPFSKVAEYSTLPKANVVFITHEHRDHLDPQALADVCTDSTVLVMTQSCTSQIKTGLVMGNGDVRTVEGVRVEAVPAYNVLHKRENGDPFHPKGVGNGYVLTFGETRVYVAGDTENIPEMEGLQNITCAFLPMNLPYTMTPEMVAEAARKFRPRILYPYHYGSTDPTRLAKLLEIEKDIEVRIRDLA